MTDTNVWDIRPTEPAYVAADPAPPVGWPDTDEPPHSADTREPYEDSPANPLPFLTLAELRAKVAAAGPRKWLIRGIWPAGDYGIHAAEQKAQKTWNTADLAVSVASGTKWLGHAQVDNPGPVLMFVGEGGEGNTVRRIEAICEERDVDPDALPIHICTRAPHLGDVVHMSLMRAKLEQIKPALVTLDPLYLAARGAELGDLYKMGALLETPQIMCQTVGASLFVVTHFNRKQGAGSGRITGAGPAEWGRVLITATVEKRSTNPETRATEVTTKLDFIGGEIPDQKLRLHRAISSDDPDDLDSQLHIATTVTYVHDDSPDENAGTESKTPPSTRNLLAALEHFNGEPRTGNELVDYIVTKLNGRPLTRETRSRHLNKLLAEDRVDVIRQKGIGQSDLWFLRRDPRDITRDDHNGDAA